MLTIYKYPAPIADHFHIWMPKGAEILSVQVQHGDAQLWAVVNPDEPLEARRFRLVGTGHGIEIPLDALLFIGTFQLHGGSLVFHLFEVVEELHAKSSEAP